MLRIHNSRKLIENGRSRVNRRARRIALRTLEGALNAVDPKGIIRSTIHLSQNRLRVQDEEFNLQSFRKIFVVGGGKASGKMAEALAEILGSRISTGIVNVPYHEVGTEPATETGSSGLTSLTGSIKLQQASHPIPDEAGLKGAREILELASKASKDDLIICLISGGGSSLMPLPRGKVSLNDKRLITESLLRSGATIDEINTVRKHVSDFKGGMLAKAAYPATIINLILSDVIGDPLDFIASGPTVPDSTTFGDAVEIVKRYKLWGKLPASARTVLTEGMLRRIPETPKKGDKVFRKVHNFIIGNNRVASLAACRSLQDQQFSSLLATSYLEGEARHVGTVLGAITREIVQSGNPLRRPCGIVAGGETTVTVTGDGNGGRSQELVLSAALKISGLKGVVVASLSTDGIDGPTSAAGALADGDTVSRALEQRLDARSHLANNDSYNFFLGMHDLLLTGPTATNVNDIAVIVVV